MISGTAEILSRGLKREGTETEQGLKHSGNRDGRQGNGNREMKSEET